MLDIKELSLHDCEIFKQINRSEKIRVVWKTTEDGSRTLDFTYLDINGYENRIDDCVKILQNVIKLNGIVFGLFEESKIIGVASILPCPKSFRDYSLLVSLDVSSESRRNGFGRLLLEACIEESNKRGCNKLVVASNPHENTIKFFKSHGFLYQKEKHEIFINGFLEFPTFDFPQPFRIGSDRVIYLELPLNEYKNNNFFSERVSLYDLDGLNCYGAMKLEILDRQSFTYGNNPVYTMACSKFEFGDNYKMLVAHFDDFPVGFMGYGINSDNKSVYIEPMMVDYMFQHRGIGKMMLDLFCDKIKNENVYKVITIGNRTDNIPAAKTYEKAGFNLIKQDGLSCFRRKEL